MNKSSMNPYKIDGSNSAVSENSPEDTQICSEIQGENLPSLTETLRTVIYEGMKEFGGADCFMSIYEGIAGVSENIYGRIREISPELTNILVKGRVFSALNPAILKRHPSISFLLFSKICASLDNPGKSEEDSLHEYLRDAVKRCFEDGVNLEDVIAFFEDEEVLRFLFKKIIDSKISEFNGTSLEFAIYSTVKSLRKKIECMSKRRKAKKVIPGSEVENILRENIKTFAEQYDPRSFIIDPRYASVCTHEFIKRIIGNDREYIQNLGTSEMETFRLSDFMVEDWLRENIHELFPILTGEDKRNENLTKIGGTITSIYHRLGEKNPEKYIYTALSKFLKIDINKGGEDNGSMSVVSIDIKEEELKTFFREHIVPLNNDRSPYSPADYRREILSKIFEFIDENCPRCNINLVNYGTGLAYAKEIDIIPIKNLIRKIVYSNTMFVETDLGEDFLKDPFGIPSVLSDRFNRFFHKDPKSAKGYSLNKKAYNTYLKAITIPTKVSEAKKEAEGLLNRVSNLMDVIFKDYKMPPYLQRIKRINDIANLTEIACLHKAPQMRWAAKLKLQLMKILYAVDYDDSTNNGELKGELLQRALIESKQIKVGYAKDFYLQDKRLMRASIENLENGKGESIDFYITAQPKGQSIVDIKKAESMALKLFRNDKANSFVEILGDRYRTTFVIDSYYESNQDINALNVLVEKIHRDFNVIDVENKYIDELPNERASKKGGNDCSSDCYKDITFKVLVPIEDFSNKGKPYRGNVLCEIKIMLKKDFMLAYDPEHRAGHNAYCERRKRKELKKSIPREIEPLAYEKKNPGGMEAWGESSYEIVNLEKLPEEYFEDKAEYDPRNLWTYEEGQKMLSINS